MDTQKWIITEKMQNLINEIIPTSANAFGFNGLNLFGFANVKDLLTGLKVFGFNGLKSGKISLNSDSFYLELGLAGWIWICFRSFINPNLVIQERELFLFHLES